MRRREFIAGLGGAATVSAIWPLAVRAQQPKVPVIGFLNGGTPESYASNAVGFAQGLKESSFVEGQNVAVEYRWGNAQPDLLPGLAADLVRRQVTVIVAGGGYPAALAASAATSTIPIVLVVGTDPVILGLAASLNRPGGNVTGVTFMTNELMSKRLGLLRELVPQAATVGYLADDPRAYASGTSIELMKKDVLAAALAFGQHVVVAEIANDRRFEAAFATFVDHHVGALIVQPSPVFSSHMDQIVSLAARHKIPAIYFRRAAAEAGGLIAYNSDLVGAWREGALYVGKILKGAKPADLPVAQSTKFELVINLKTAKALGLTIPETLLATADEVIQ